VVFFIYILLFRTDVWWKDFFDFFDVREKKRRWLGTYLFLVAVLSGTCVGPEPVPGFWCSLLFFICNLFRLVFLKISCIEKYGHTLNWESRKPMVKKSHGIIPLIREKGCPGPQGNI